MDTICTAIRQAFMPTREYQRLREEEKAWNKLRKPVYTAMFCILILAIIVPTFVSLAIALWPEDSPSRPFCDEWGRSMKTTTILNETFAEGHDDLFEDDTMDQEAITYYLYRVFLTSFGLFLVSAPGLFAGMAVAYTAPRRHMFLRVYEYEYSWASTRIDGVTSLIIFNIVFAILFAVVAIIEGPTIRRPGSSCSLPLFWCYEMSTWGLVILFVATSIILKKRSVGMLTIVDQLELDIREEYTPLEIFIHQMLQYVEDTFERYFVTPREEQERRFRELLARELAAAAAARTRAEQELTSYYS